MIDSTSFDRIMIEAGRLALATWPGDGHRPRMWRKDDASPVCAADLAVNDFLRDELGRLLPEAGWLSEETVDAPGRSECPLAWIVDPIDGTRDYLNAQTGWAVSVALVVGGWPHLGALMAPARGEYWTARAGQGAQRNGRPLAASRRKALPGARVPADFLHKDDVDLVRVDKPNSIALRIAMVAADEADVLAGLRWGYEWDIAAAALIAAEAGATITDAHGGPLGFNKRDPRAFGVLAAAPAIHGAAVERISERARRYSA